MSDLSKESQQDRSASPQTLLTIEEVASILRCSPRSVRRYASDGRLRVTRVGSRNVRFDPRDVADFLRNGIGVPR